MELTAFLRSPHLSKFFNSSFCFGLCFVLEHFSTLPLWCCSLIFCAFPCALHTIPHGSTIYIHDCYWARSFFSLFSFSAFFRIAEFALFLIHEMDEEDGMGRKRRRNLIFLNVFKSKRFFTFFASQIIFPCTFFPTHTLEWNEARMLRNKSQIFFSRTMSAFFVILNAHISTQHFYLILFSLFFIWVLYTNRVV